MLYLTSCIRPAEQVREPGKPDDGNPVCTSMLADVEPETSPIRDCLMRKWMDCP